MPHFTSDLNATATPLPHFWEECLGSGHAPLALRADWQTQVKRCRDELGTKRIRFHGLLSGRMGTLLIHKDRPLYSFHNVDAAYDAMLDLRVRPVVELSFMPQALASGGKTVMQYADNVTPPKDWDLWDTLISKLATHWVDRYGIDEASRWPIEVWNEPNLEAFYTGKLDDYQQLYEHTSRTIKGVDARLQVGGPVTAKNEWLHQFVGHCERNDLPLDFLSTHIYPTDAKGSAGDDTISQLAGSHLGVLKEKAQAAHNAAKGRPVYYTEWSSSSNPRDELHDEPFAAAYLVYAILNNVGLVDMYSWWTFSDIFEENWFPSQVFQGGFGLLTIYNTPKPAFAAFRLLHALGDELLPCEGGHETAACWVTRSADEVTVMLVNVALPRHDIATQSVKVTLKGCREPSGVYVRRIDDEHANPKRLWKEMGEPRYLKERQVAMLDDAGRPQGRPLACDFDKSSGTLEFSLDLPPLSVALVTVVIEPGEVTSEAVPPVAELPGANAPPPEKQS